MEDYFRSIRMPVNLRELGVGELTEEQIDELAEKCTYFGRRPSGSSRSWGKRTSRPFTAWPSEGTAMKKILVIGSMNLDFVTSVPHMPRVGETVLAQGWNWSPGARGPTRPTPSGGWGPGGHAGCLGQDSFGDRLLENLSKAGVDTRGWSAGQEASTSMAVIGVDPQGTTAFWCCPGPTAWWTGPWWTVTWTCWRGATFWPCSWRSPWTRWPTPPKRPRRWARPWCWTQLPPCRTCRRSCTPAWI